MKRYTILDALPKFYHCLYENSNHDNAVLIMELLGRSLDYIWEQGYKKRFSIKTTMMIGLQIVIINLLLSGWGFFFFFL